ncbi:M15 family metallopeptidase [Methylotenera sp. G11]|uniref:M15 family metallopeptidase n=1 Tax=Methylotenera sp. G11 TaxID=1506585 RepID=UPI0009DDF72B|nr:M15 family metallopeptidase [Methylotenera sp. G11]
MPPDILPLRFSRAMATAAFLTAAFLTTGAMLHPVSAIADDYPHMQILLETGQTIAGEPLAYPPGQAKVTSAIITIPPGKSTGWHKHKVPLVAYMLAGELETEYADGRRVQLKQGQALMEAISVSHIGANLGSSPAQFFVAFLGADHADYTEITNAPTTPPATPDATASVDLVDLAAFDKRLQLDIRYATANNFMAKPLYPVARAMLQRPAAEALRKAHDRLHAAGYGLIVFDAYRPWQVTREMWDQHPMDRPYLSDPLKGSRHNRGCAIDLTLYDLKTGKEVTMPSTYDEFTERAHPDYKGGTPEQRKLRDLLRSAMEAEGFTVYRNEWWHFDYNGWEAYPVLNQPLQ